jgi:hypothetical protein
MWAALPSTKRRTITGIVHMRLSHMRKCRPLALSFRDRSFTRPMLPRRLSGIITGNMRCSAQSTHDEYASQAAAPKVRFTCSWTAQGDCRRLLASLGMACSISKIVHSSTWGSMQIAAKLQGFPENHIHVSIYEALQFLSCCVAHILPSGGRQPGSICPYCFHPVI